MEKFAFYGFLYVCVCVFGFFKKKKLLFHFKVNRSSSLVVLRCEAGQYGVSSRARTVKVHLRVAAYSPLISA